MPFWVVQWGSYGVLPQQIHSVPHGYYGQESDTVQNLFKLIFRMKMLCFVHF